MYFCENHILILVQNPIFAGTYLEKKQTIVSDFFVFLV